MDQSPAPPPKLPGAALGGAILSVIFITLITVLADLQPDLKDWLKATFAHHWVGKGVLATAVFLLGTVLASAGQAPSSEEAIRNRVRALGWTTIAGTLVLFLFFLYEAFIKK